MNDSIKLAVKGKVYFPKNENGGFTCAIAVDEATQQKMRAQCIQTYGMTVSFSSCEFHDQELTVFNTKSQYSVPVVDKDNNPIYKSGTKEYTDVYNGAEVIAAITLKPYEYRGKKGVTTYIRAFKLLSEVKESSFEDMFNIIL